MENPTQSKADYLESHLPPPHESRLTTILNGVGNWTMVCGALSYAGARIVAHVKSSSPNLERATMFGSIAGCGIGAVLGMREAKHIENYRTAVSGEIDSLHRRLLASNDKIDALTRQIEAQDPQKTR